MLPGCSTTITKACKKTANCPAGETCRLWKYVEYVTGETELYNLNNDPFELTNRTNNPGLASVKTLLANKLHQLQAQ